MFRRRWDGDGPGVVTLGARWTAAEHTKTCNVTTVLEMGLSRNPGRRLGTGLLSSQGNYPVVSPPHQGDRSSPQKAPAGETFITPFINLCC